MVKNEGYITNSKYIYIYTWKFEEGVKIDIQNGIVICAQHKNNEIALYAIFPFLE